jgi:hypothetical protein
MGKCPYANIFQAPGTGPHAYRFMGFAVVDTVLTVLAAWLAYKWVGVFSFVVWLVGFLVLAEVSHYAFGVQTAGLTALGIRVQCDDS